MKQKVNSALLHLAQAEPKEIQVIHWFVSFRWLRFKVHLLPFPAKLAIVNTLLLPVILILVPMPDMAPHILIPILWGGSYCLSFTMASLLPHKMRSSVTIKHHTRIHWIN